MTEVAPALLAAWLAGRSLARGLPPPVADRGGFRVDTAGPDEVRRWVFARPEPGLVALGRSVRDSREPLKLCDTARALLALLPPGWQPQRAPAWFMVGGPALASAPAPLPAGYALAVERGSRRATVRVLTATGIMAASGHCGETAAGFVYDRIVTDPGHRRRGLGRAVMQALGALRRDPGAPELLVATADGRALYETLGWRMRAPYATATWAGG